MKRCRGMVIAYLAATVFWSAAGQASPLPCSSTVATALSTLTQGCTINDKLFANFTAKVGQTDVSQDLTLTSIDEGGNLLREGFSLGLPVALPIGVSAAVPLFIGYTVTVLDPLSVITDIHLGLTGSTTGLVTETVKSGLNVLAELQVGTDPLGAFLGNTADAFFEGVDTIAVLKEITNIDVFANDNTIRQEITQSPVPEPASLLVFATALLGMAVARRKLRT